MFSVIDIRVVEATMVDDGYFRCGDRVMLHTSSKLPFVVTGFRPFFVVRLSAYHMRSGVYQDQRALALATPAALQRSGFTSYAFVAHADQAISKARSPRPKFAKPQWIAQPKHD